MFFLTLIVTILVIFVLIQVVGRLLPASFRAQSSETIDASPGKLWTILVNHAQEKDWRSDLIAIDKVSGAGSQQVWREIRRGGLTLQLKTVESDAPHRLVREIVNSKELGGRITCEIEPVREESSRLTVTEEIEVKKPWRRIKMQLLSSKSAHVEQFVHDVKQRAIHLKELEEEE